MPPIGPPYRPHGTAEYFFDDIDDAPDDHASKTVDAALKPARTEPDVGDWTAGSWDPSKQATIAWWYPGDLPAGWYRLWVRIDGTIVRECGPVRLT